VSTSVISTTSCNRSSHTSLRSLLTVTARCFDMSHTSEDFRSHLLRVFYVATVVTLCLPAVDNPWRLDAYKMRYDSQYWFPSSVPLPAPVVNKSYLLMCEVRGAVRPSPRISWYLGARQIKPGKHFYIIVRRQSSCYTLHADNHANFNSLENACINQHFTLFWHFTCTRSCSLLRGRWNRTRIEKTV